MKINRILTQLSSLSMIATLLVGCGGGDPAKPVAVEGGPPSHDAHAHPSEGPHGGGLIELGNEAYHAELVHDEASGEVTIYILDGAAKNEVAIESKEITINLKHGDTVQQFVLATSPQATDTAGKSSKFVALNAKLGEELHEGHDSAQLVLTIAGKQYRGAIKHDHDHGHDHKGHDHDDHTHGDNHKH